MASLHSREIHKTINSTSEPVNVQSFPGPQDSCAESEQQCVGGILPRLLQLQRLPLLEMRIISLDINFFLFIYHTVYLFYGKVLNKRLERMRIEYI